MKHIKRLFLGLAAVGILALILAIFAGLGYCVIQAIEHQKYTYLIAPALIVLYWVGYDIDTKAGTEEETEEQQETA